ncbi:NUDIX domain-containing protein [Halorussus pelagicus]|uniref:NUDIX domain-containing protein n=1 Tax=Halorussus pelagicus TaxID=2505977 RepID=UPI000FFC3719|nr:NUDIX domain-containing protein [Halorussus pelagicus]
MTDRHVRVSARGVVRRGEELLVARDRDPVTGESFCYLLGGGANFGEHTEEALHREFDEELGVALENVSSLETYEDVFTSGGETEHEVWRVYEADIAEAWPYEQSEFEGYEPEHDEVIECVWKSPSSFRDGGETLYPEPVVSDL